MKKTMKDCACCPVRGSTGFHQMACCTQDGSSTKTVGSFDCSGNAISTRGCIVWIMGKDFDNRSIHYRFGTSSRHSSIIFRSRVDTVVKWTTVKLASSSSWSNTYSFNLQARTQINYNNNQMNCGSPCSKKGIGRLFGCIGGFVRYCFDI